MLNVFLILCSLNLFSSSYAQLSTIYHPNFNNLFERHYNERGIDQYGFNFLGKTEKGKLYNANGFNWLGEHISKRTRPGTNIGIDAFDFDMASLDAYGFDRSDKHYLTRTGLDPKGFNKKGQNIWGFDRVGNYNGREHNETDLDGFDAKHQLADEAEHRKAIGDICFISRAKLLPIKHLPEGIVNPLEMIRLIEKHCSFVHGGNDFDFKDILERREKHLDAIFPLFEPSVFYVLDLSRENIVSPYLNTTFLDSTHQIKVFLDGEEGQDEGGLRREIVSLFYSELIAKKILIPDDLEYLLGPYTLSEKVPHEFTSHFPGDLASQKKTFFYLLGKAMARTISIDRGVGVPLSPVLLLNVMLPDRKNIMTRYKNFFPIKTLEFICSLAHLKILDPQKFDNYLKVLSYSPVSSVLPDSVTDCKRDLLPLSPEVYASAYLRTHAPLTEATTSFIR